MCVCMYDELMYACIYCHVMSRLDRKKDTTQQNDPADRASQRSGMSHAWPGVS